MNTAATDINAYLESVREPARTRLSELRRTIRAIAPDAVESISYGVPTFKYKGRPLVYFAAARKHCAIYGVPIDTHQEELAAYDTAKGTIRFPPDEPFPDALLRSLVRERMATIEAAATTRKRKPVAGPSS
jgi:uncharacterized protein YdhG (YjbR/CyaY superfamily)